MEDKEFDFVNKKCKRYLKSNRYGKFVMIGINEILEKVFREGYTLGFC